MKENCFDLSTVDADLEGINELIAWGVDPARGMAETLADIQIEGNHLTGQELDRRFSALIFGIIDRLDQVESFLLRLYCAEKETQTAKEKEKSEELPERFPGDHGLKQFKQALDRYKESGP